MKRDYVGGSWEDIRSHVEDEYRSKRGIFEMNYAEGIYTDRSGGKVTNLAIIPLGATVNGFRIVRVGKRIDTSHVTEISEFDNNLPALPLVAAKKKLDEIAQLSVGDTVRVIAPECNGQVGELAVIDDEDVYGVWLDTVGQQMFFSREEIEKVSPEQALFDEAVARAQALGRPFEDEEVFGPIWEQGIELVPQMDSRFVLHQEATRRTPRLWSVVNMAELPF